ncbi:MAG: NADH-quinone oxidoreductase subunit E, partial [Alistipes sp.]|nr:NADH-quinone oxidoreductase subunit E [Alistipes sp.]
RMQYTGESFSEGLESVAESLTQNKVEGRAVDKSEIFPTEHSFKVRHKDRVDSLMAEWWMASLRIINARIMRLRTGKINHYVAFALLLLVLVFALSVLNLL